MTIPTKTKVAVTTEKSSPGVPLWGANQVITEIPSGETVASFENLLAGRKYYIRAWTEDAFGNASPEVVRVINTHRTPRFPPYRRASR